jgi:hypothetical protein
MQPLYPSTGTCLLLTPYPFYSNGCTPGTKLVFSTLVTTESSLPLTVSRGVAMQHSSASRAGRMPAAGCIGTQQPQMDTPEPNVPVPRERPVLARHLPVGDAATKAPGPLGTGFAAGIPVLHAIAGTGSTPGARPDPNGSFQRSESSRQPLTSPADIERRQRRHVGDVGVARRDRQDLHRAVEADQKRADARWRRPSSCSMLVEIAAECRAGITSTLAGPESRQNG